MKFKITFFITALLFVLMTFFTIQTNAKESAASPKAVIEPTTVEFPQVIEGAVVTRVFKVLNKGDATLDIPGIHTE